MDSIRVAVVNVVCLYGCLLGGDSRTCVFRSTMCSFVSGDCTDLVRMAICAGQGDGQLLELSISNILRTLSSIPSLNFRFTLVCIESEWPSSLRLWRIPDSSTLAAWSIYEGTSWTCLRSKMYLVGQDEGIGLYGEAGTTSQRGRKLRQHPVKEMTKMKGSMHTRHQM